MCKSSLLILPGDGIGPEVMVEVRKIIDWFGSNRGLDFDVTEDLVGGAAYDAHGTSLHDETMAKALNVDANGLDEMDIRILKAVVEKFGGGPVGLTTIATAIGENAGTIEEVYEPFLIQEGFLMRTPRGRKATEKSYKHLGVDMGFSQGGLF